MRFLSFNLQAEVLPTAASKLIDYGIIGIVVLFLGFIAWKFFEKIDENSQEWKEQAKIMSEKYSQLHLDQIQNSAELIRIRNQDIEQNREHHRKLEKQMDALPNQIMREWKLAALKDRNDRPNTTPAD